MPDQPMTFEELCTGILAPWYSDQPLAVGSKVATPRDAAAHALLAALNAPEGKRGVIRVLVKTSEEKRQVRNHWDAFVLDQPKLKAMVRKVMPEVIHLHGGLSLHVDTNDVRLAKDAVSTIVLDPTANEAIGSVWVDDGETKEEAAVRRGYTVDQVPQLRFIRWMTPEEAKVAKPIAHPLDAAHEPGPPQDEPQGSDPEVDPQARLEQEQRYREAVERLARERINEKLAAANRAFGRSIA